MTATLRIFTNLHKRASALVGPMFSVGFSVGEVGDFPKARNMAYCTRDDDTGELTIVVAPKLLLGDTPRVEGVLRHEFGHALLFFWGHLDHGERDADNVAEQVFGDPIFYDRETVQTLCEGLRPRPAYLGT